MVKFKKWFCNIFEEWKHLLILSYFVIYLAWFSYVEKAVTTHFHVIHVTIDDYIPFCEYFIIPYVLWFGYVAWGVVHSAIHSKEDYFKLCGVLFTGMTIFLIISTVYPNGHYLRPRYFAHHNFCTTIVGWLYSTDTATNLFPSIHVYNSLAVHFFVMNSKDFKDKKTVRIMSLVLCISIILATMFLKQHSAFDVATAFVLAVFMYQGVYIRGWFGASNKNTGKYTNNHRIPQI